MNHFIYNYNRIDNELIVAYALGQSLFEPLKIKATDNVHMVIVIHFLLKIDG